MISDDDIRRFEEEGYLVVRHLLDPPSDLYPLMAAQTALVEALADIYDAELNRPPPASAEDRRLGKRLAGLLGTSGGDALNHLAPVLNIFSPRFRVRSDLPSAQLPHLFDLLRNEKLLDVVERLIGPEICASPSYHVTMKLSDDDLRLAESIAASLGRRSPSRTANYEFEVAPTPWHTDVSACLDDAYDSRIVVAWVSMTRADDELGCLQLLPGSHRVDVRGRPIPDDLTRGAIVLEARPGDVVFMDNKLVHGATRNRTVDEVRWAGNFRYLPAGQPTGRPYLPAFVARSGAAPHTELRNPYLWQALWVRAFENLARGELPVSKGTTSPTEAEAVTRRWVAATPDARGWLRLREHPMRSRISMLIRRVRFRVERWIRERVSH